MKKLKTSSRVFTTALRYLLTGVTLAGLLATVVSLPGFCQSALANEDSGNATARLFYTSISSQIVTFDSPTVVQVMKGKYDRLILADCEYMSQLGYPSLPYKVIVFKANLGFDISGVSVDVSTKDLSGSYHVMPAPKPSLFGDGDGLSQPDSVVYSSDEPYPGKWYSYDVKVGIDPETMTRIKYVVVHLYPLQYKPLSGKIIEAKNATVDVDYSGSPTNAPLSSTDFLIITSSALEIQANSLASFKNSQGISTIVKTTDWIYDWYDHSHVWPPEAPPDDQQKIRAYIKSISSLKYVLLFGDETQVPVRYAYIYIYEGWNEYGPVPTDLYYADLDGTWNDDGDGHWGEPIDDNIDGFPALRIGRLPASNHIEAKALLNKIIAYEENTSLDDPWFKRALLIGTDTHGDREGERLKDYIADSYIPAGWTVTKLYETYGNLSVTDSIENQINNGCGLVNYAGHGNYDNWNLGLLWSFHANEVSSELTNSPKLPVVVAKSCLTSKFDESAKCIGEAFVLNPSGGGIAYFGATRVSPTELGVLVTSKWAGQLDCMFSEKFFSGERVAGKV